MIIKFTTHTNKWYRQKSRAQKPILRFMPVQASTVAAQEYQRNRIVIEETREIVEVVQYRLMPYKQLDRKIIVNHRDHLDVV